MTPALICLTIALLAVSLLPLSKRPHGFVRGPAFARLQWAALAALLLPLALFTDDGLRLWIVVGLILVLAINAAYVMKFTPLWPKQVPDATPQQRQKTDRRIRVLSSNIKLSNRAYDRFHAMIKQTASDIVVVIEPDADWLAQLDDLRRSHPYYIEHPADTGYGLALYSRLPLGAATVKDRITTGVPSIHCAVTLPDGSLVSLYALHPEPPIASHDTIGRDSEIAQIGLAAAQDPLPTIVTGDLNDVAWSTTTRRFQRLSGLLDPRVGRGVFNTFHAHYPMFRWPLDHVFHDRQFRLVSLTRLPDIGSDHFPIHFELVLAQTEAGTEIPHDKSEARETRKVIDKEANRDRDAIGTDWEDDA